VALHFSDDGHFCDMFVEGPDCDYVLSLSYDEGLELVAIGQDAGAFREWLERRAREYAGQNVERFPLTRARQHVFLDEGAA
jgi:hypothetical protein